MKAQGKSAIIFELLKVISKIVKLSILVKQYFVEIEIFCISDEPTQQQSIPLFVGFLKLHQIVI